MTGALAPFSYLVLYSKERLTLRVRCSKVLRSGLLWPSSQILKQIKLSVNEHPGLFFNAASDKVSKVLTHWHLVAVSFEFSVSTLL